MIRSSSIVAVHDTSQVAEARRVAMQCAEALQMRETAVGKAGLIATELATNLVKHGGGGSILFASDEARTSSLVIISIDKGRGIDSLSTAMADGYSTSGSPGTGLGAISRAASFHDVYTLPQKGTTILCRVDDAPASTAPAFAAPSRITIGGICLPTPKEDIPGDAWIAVNGREVTTIAVADGLGHGPFAATAATAFIRVVREQPDLPLEQLMEEGHGALRATRGAAVGIARIYSSEGRLDFVGVGNIAATITTDVSHRKTVSHNGIVGHEMRKVQTFSYPWSADSVLAMQSDGVSASWNMNHYPGLSQREPALIAAVVYRDYCRGNDDATVVVAKAS